MANIQVHRFRDMVAVSVGFGETVYLTPDESAAFGSAVVNCAADTKVRKFEYSNFGTFSIEVASKK